MAGIWLQGRAAGNHGLPAYDEWGGAEGRAAMTFIDRFLFLQTLKWSVTFGLILVHTIVFAGMAIMAPKIIQHNLPLSTLWIAYLGLLPNAFYLTLPLCTALAALWVYGHLWHSRAMVVLYGAGISTLRLAAPGIAVALVATVGAAVTGHYLAPLGAAALEDAKHQLRHGASTRNLRSAQFNTFEEDRVIIYFQSWARPGVMKKPLLHDRRDAKNPVTIVAREAYADRVAGKHVLKFRNGVIYEGAPPREMRSIHFQRFAISVKVRLVPARVGRPPYELDTSVLLNPPPSWADDIRMTMDARAELQKRLVVPTLAIVFVIFVLGTVLCLVPGSARPILVKAAIGMATVLAYIGLAVMADTGARYSNYVIALTYLLCAAFAVAGCWLLWTANQSAIARPRMMPSLSFRPIRLASHRRIA